MSRLFPRIVIVFIFGLFVISQPSFAAGGTCPSGANYLSLSSPVTGGGQGSVTLTSLGINSCFYIAASGSDTNSGADESHPWLHAPGMPTCTGNCAATTPTGNEGFIFRGGDSWHKSSGSPGTGGEWNFGWAGSNMTNPIYLGVDFSWFSGASFARPIFNEDNPVTTNEPASCSYPDDATTYFAVAGPNVIADMFEFTGGCASGNGTGQQVNNGSGTVFERFYIHGWTVASSATDDSRILLGNGNGGVPDNTNRILFVVVDGSDSTWGNVCTSPSCVASFGGNTHGGGTGYALSSCWDVEYTIIRHTSQGMLCGDASIIHDNLLEYIFNPGFGGRHGNVFEIITPGSGTLCQNLVAYNNVTRNTDEGVNWWPQCPNYYLFNNVWANSGHYAPDPNGLMLSPPGASGSSKVTAYIFNNSFQANQVQAGPANAQTPGWASGSVAYFGNNHIMDFTSVNSFFTCSSGNTCGVTDNGGEVFQTTQAANNQGYVISNSYSPTSASGSTVGAGNNNSSWCSTVPDANGAAACASGSSGSVFEQGSWGGMMSVYSSFSPNQRSGAWDGGAYQYSSSGPPAPPSGLAANVQQ